MQRVRYNAHTYHRRTSINTELVVNGVDNDVGAGGRRGHIFACLDP